MIDTAHQMCIRDSINAANNYQNDGDSVYRLFYDTVKGGDYRAREANVYRLAEVSNNIIAVSYTHLDVYKRQAQKHRGGLHRGRRSYIHQ